MYEVKVKVLVEYEVTLDSYDLGVSDYDNLNENQIAEKATEYSELHYKDFTPQIVKIKTDVEEFEETDDSSEIYARRYS
jgi:hypothetical protein